MAIQFELATCAVAGAALQEVLWWHNVRRRLTDNDLSFAYSKGYWAITGCFILFTGIVALVWFGESAASPRDALVFGAFLPSIVKQLGRATQKEQALGDEVTMRTSLNRYLGA